MMPKPLLRNELKAIYTGDEIRRYRNEICYTQTYMASRLGIAQSTYQRIENGEINITLERLQEIAAILSKPIEIFLSGNEVAGLNDKHNSISQNIFVNEREWELMQKVLLQQEKRIEELEAKIQRRDLKIEELKLQIEMGRN